VLAGGVAVHQRVPRKSLESTFLLRMKGLTEDSRGPERQLLDNIFTWTGLIGAKLLVAVIIIIINSKKNNNNNNNNNVQTVTLRH